MLAAWLKKEMAKEAEEMGWSEGRAQIQKAWKLRVEDVEAWEQRKSEVEGDSGVFIEPRPTQPSDELVTAENNDYAG